jgi:fucose permease
MDGREQVSIKAPAVGMFMLLLLYLGFVSIGLPDAAFGVAWPSLRDAFALPQSQFGVALAFIGAGFLVASSFAGRFLAAMGVGRLLALATTITGIGLAGFALAPGWPAFLAFGLLVGFGGGAIDSGLNAYAASRLSARHMNWLHAAFGLGAGLGPFAMTAAVGLASWRFGYGALALVMLALATLFVVTRGVWGTAVGHDAAADEASISAGQAMRIGLVWLQVFAFFTYVGAEISLGQWTYAILTESRGYSIEMAGFWAGAFWLALFAGRIILGALAERIGAERLLRMAVLGAFVGYVLFAVDPAGLGPAGLVIAGFMLAPIFPLLMHRTPRMLGLAAPHAIGFQVSAAMLGGIVTPAVAGIIADNMGLAAIPYFLLGVVVINGILIVICLGMPPWRAGREG